MEGLKTCLVIQSQDPTADYLLNCKIGTSPIKCNNNLSAVRLETTKVCSPFNLFPCLHIMLKLQSKLISSNEPIPCCRCFLNLSTEWRKQMLVLIWHRELLKGWVCNTGFQFKGFTISERFYLHLLFLIFMSSMVLSSWCSRWLEKSLVYFLEWILYFPCWHLGGF